MPPSSSDEASRWVRLFPYLFAVVLLWRLFLAWRFPFLGDEAYFLLWGRRPELGYYDHPPMIGWWLAPLARLGEHPWLLRLPTVLVIAGIGWAIFRLSRVRAGRDVAATLSLLFLVSPFYLVDVFALTDTPLLLFTFLAGVCYWRGVEGGSRYAFLASGAFLGLAFLSKYLAVLLGLAFAVHAVVDRRRRVLGGLALVVAGALPFVALNLWWNAHHGWVNVLFNLHHRHVGEAERYTWRNVVYCLAAHIWLLGPVGAALVPWRGARWLAVLRPPQPSLLAYAALIPLALLSASSVLGPFGAYWLMPFYPFLYLLLPSLLGRNDLRRMLLGMGVFAAIHVVVFTWALSRPLDAWQGRRFYDSLVMMERPDEVAQAVRDVAGGAPLAATGYSPASLLAWATGEHVSVFGHGSHYGRHDDFWTDWSRLDGGSLAIFSKTPLSLEEVAPWFDAVRAETIEVEGARYEVVAGDGFRFERYRRDVLEPLCRRYYSPPAWWPAGRDGSSACPLTQPTTTNGARSSGSGDPR